MTNSIEDFKRADLLLIIGSNTTECHPIIGRFVRQGVQFRNTKLIVADARSIELSQIAHLHLRHNPGTDVALINGLMNVILTEELHDKEFVEKRTEGFDELFEMVKQYPPEVVEEITGVPQSDIIEAARMFAAAERACVLYGMGITQHTTGTDNVMSLANLVMITGNVGREGTGLSPLRGQNNVQGACDMGALPNVYPGYQAVNNELVKEKFESAWGCTLSDKPGMPVTDMIEVALEGTIRAMYVIGENPLMSDPNIDHVKHALEQLECLIVQDVFPTETALTADVILPAAMFAEKNGTHTNTERRVQMLNKALEPPEEAKPDWVIINELSAKMGTPFNYRNTAEIMDEVASLTPIYGGIHHDRLDEYGLQWPCTDREHPGTPILHENQFVRGKGNLKAIEFRPPAEAISKEYPLTLTTGRILEHWHTGSMSRRSSVLHALQPRGTVDLHPDDAVSLGILEGDTVALESKRGKIEAMAHITDKTSPGLAFMAFHWSESPANRLTNAALDPTAKIPEYKVSAVKAVLSVLDRAAQDNEFFARLAEDPAEALREYNLTDEEKEALTSGDIDKIESKVGKLDERLKKWLVTRLQQVQL
jgi:formate dehydrogenase alpha subunit